MTPSPRLLVPLTLLLSACATGRPGAAPQAQRPGAPVVARGQPEAEARAADLAFSAATAAHDERAFASFIAPDAVFVSREGVAVGVAAIGIDWAPLLAPEGPTLTWAPDSALAAGSGDLVLTRGGWTLASPAGAPAGAGRYVTLWRREPDGKLRAVLDALDAPLPLESASATRHPLRRLISSDERVSAVAGLLLDGLKEVGGFMLVEVREGDTWRLLVEVGSWRPGGR